MALIALTVFAGTAQAANFFVSRPGDWDDTDVETTPWNDGLEFMTQSPVAGDWVLFHGNGNEPNDMCVTFTGTTGAAFELQIGSEWGAFSGGTPTAFFHQMSGTLNIEEAVKVGINAGGVADATGRGLYILDPGASLNVTNLGPRIGTQATGGPTIATFVAGGSVTAAQVVVGSADGSDASSTLVLDGSAYNLDIIPPGDSTGQFIVFSANSHIVVRPDASGNIGTITTERIRMVAGDIEMDLCNGYTPSIGDTWTLMTGTELVEQATDIVSAQSAYYDVNYLDNGDGTFSVEIECTDVPPAAGACVDYAADIVCDDVNAATPVVGQITADPESPVDAGTNVTLTAPAGSSYQWYKDGTVVTDATAQTLEFTPAEVADSGAYEVEYDDGARAMVITEPYTLVVNALTTGQITANPTQVEAGDMLTLTAPAGSSYQWYKDGVVMTDSLPPNDTSTSSEAFVYTFDCNAGQPYVFDYDMTYDNGEVVLTCDPAAAGWSGTPYIQWPVPEFVQANYPHVAVKLSISNSGVTDPLWFQNITFDVDGGGNWKFATWDQTSILRNDMTTPDGAWGANSGVKSTFRLDLPAGSIPAQFDWANVEIRIDWIAMSNDPNFDNPIQGTTDCFGRISGTNSQTLVFDPVEEEDEGSYTCEYDDGARTIVVTDPYILTVWPAGALPVAGFAGLALLGAAAAAVGIRQLRRKQ